RRHTRFSRDWSSDVCSSDLTVATSSIARFSEGVTPTPTVAVRDSGVTWLIWLSYLFGIKRRKPPLTFLCLRILGHVQEKARALEIGRASCRERVEKWEGG